MFAAIAKIVAGALSPLTSLIDEITTTDEEKMKLKNQLALIQNDLANRLLEYFQKELEARKEIILAEIKHGWLTRNWRPILMLVVVAIVANNYIIYPYLQLFGIKSTALELPDKLWNLMQIGVGGYVAGRSIEKAIQYWKQGDKANG